MVTTKWDCHRKRRFASNYFIFWKFCFSLKTLINNWFNVPTAQTPIFVLFLSAAVSLNGTFSLWVSLNELRCSSHYYWTFIKKRVKFYRKWCSFLWQNGGKFYWKITKAFYHKIHQFYYKNREVLQNNLACYKHG